jgi:phenylalanyl-tRNA synthetase beta chain
VSSQEAWPVEVEDPTGCPVFVARTVSGFDPSAPTPDWMVRRLALVGQRSISLAVDVTNYVMFELGRPIHGYDADKVQGTLRIRRAAPAERLTTLDGQDRALSPEDLVVTDDSGIIGLGGVMGGETTEMSATTTRVLVEAAHWDAVSMFRTGRRHRLSSEAGKRNERGVDPTTCGAAADRVVELLAELGGVTVVGTPPAPATITLPIDLPARITGMDIASETTIRALRDVGCEVDAGADELTAVAPPWRPDLTDPYDLVEEVARVVGYDEVPSVLPPAPAGRGLTRDQRLRRRIGHVVAGAGYTEVISFPFVGPQDFDDLGLPEDDVLRRTVRLANPLSSERPSYTTTLLPGVLRTAARNLGRGAPGVSLFETGLVAFPTARHAPIYGVDRRPSEQELAALLAAVPEQPLVLAAVVAGERERAGWWGQGRGASWADAVALVRDLADDLGVAVDVVATERAPWHPGRCALLRVGELELGHAGELHPRVCAAFGLPRGTSAAEIDLDLLMSRAPEPRGPQLSTYPVAKEDVALVVDADLPAGVLAATLREGAGPLCESVRLFDVYNGPQVGDGRRSLAFALRFRAPDRTLTEQETGAARDAAVALAARRHAAEQRS